MDFTSVSTTDGHTINWHDTGRKFLRSEIDAIAGARNSILFEHYIFRASPVGDRFRDALTEAAQRGVRVTVLLDYAGCLALPRTYFSEMSALGGKVIWFNPVRWRFWSFRDHRKILVVDGMRAFIGGCNIAPEYDGDGIAEGWRDGGIEITGPVVNSLTVSIENQIRRADKIWRVRPREQSGSVKAEADVSLLLTKPGFHQGVLLRALRGDLARARDVAITTAYFLPVGRAKRMLLRAARQARNFRLLLPGKSDVPMMQVAARASYGQFQRRGAKVFEYQPQVLHAKIIVIDDVVYVGSANLDPRSLSINFEVMLRIRSGLLAKQARETFERDLQHSQSIAKLSWRKPGNWWQRLKQRLARMLFVRLDLGIAQFIAQKVETHGRPARDRTRRPAP